MGKLNLDELAKVPYLNPKAVGARSILLMPLWDGKNWHRWIDHSEGQIIKLQTVDEVRSVYIAKEPARPDDFWI